MQVDLGTVARTRPPCRLIDRPQLQHGVLLTHVPTLGTDDPEARALRRSLALVWLGTGLLVVTPGYQMEGTTWLARLGLPAWPMFVTCSLEVVLGVALLLRPAGHLLSVLQAGSVLVFTAILASLDPMLLVHPLGMLSKNLPFVLVVATVWSVERQGWTPRSDWLLRVAMAVVWISEGLFPKLLFQQEWELELATTLHLPGEPWLLIGVLGVAQLLSGIGALLLRGSPLRWLLLAQLLALLVLPTAVGVVEPEWLLHPFGPLLKNVPLVVGSWLLYRRC